MKYIYQLHTLLLLVSFLPIKAQNIVSDCKGIVDSELCEEAAAVLNDFFRSFEADNVEDVLLVYLADPPVNEFTDFWRGRRAKHNLTKQQFFESLDKHKQDRFASGWKWELKYIHHYIFRDPGDLVNAQFHSLVIIDIIDANGIRQGEHIVEIKGRVRSDIEYQILSIRPGSIEDFSNYAGLDIGYVQTDIFRTDRESSGLFFGTLGGFSLLEMKHLTADLSPKEWFAGLSFEWFPSDKKIGVSTGLRFHRAQYNFYAEGLEHIQSSREDIQIYNITNSSNNTLNSDNQIWTYKASNYELQSTQSLLAIPVSMNYRILESNKFSLIFGLHYTYQIRTVKTHRESLLNSTVDLLVDGKSFNSDRYNNQLLPLVGSFGDSALNDRLESWLSHTHLLGAGLSFRYMFGRHLVFALNLSAEADLKSFDNNLVDKLSLQSLQYSVDGESGSIDFPLRSYILAAGRYMIGFGVYYVL